MLQRVICAIGGHAIARNRVWFDGIEFRTKCRRCSQPLLRTQDGWKRVQAGELDESSRLPHPRERETGEARR